MKNASTHEDRVVTREQLADVFGIRFSKPTLLRWEKAGTFPKRFYLSEKRPCWFERDVRAWLATRASVAEVRPAIARFDAQVAV